jgi:polyribonucleotide nucleotidyltransferase
MDVLPSVHGSALFSRGNTQAHALPPPLHTHTHTHTRATFLVHKPIPRSILVC